MLKHSHGKYSDEFLINGNSYLYYQDKKKLVFTRFKTNIKYQKHKTLFNIYRERE